MMNSFALQNIINLTQGSGAASHPGRTLEGPGFPIFLAMEQLAAEQASIPSDAFSPDSDGQIVKALGNGQRIDLTKVRAAPVEKGAELAYSKKTLQLSNQGIKKSSIKHQVFSIRYPVSRNLDLHRSDPRPGLRIQDSRLKTQDSNLSPVLSPKSHVSSLISQVSCLMPCVYPLTDQVVKGDITLSEATEDVHRLDVSLMNAGADIRALRHTSYVMRHRHDVSQPSVVHITWQPETIERVSQTSPPDQPFLRFEPTGQSQLTMDHQTRITDHGSRITGHGSPITDHRSRTHGVIYTNAREVLPRNFVLRSGVIPDDITESPHVVVLSKSPAGKQIFYANPKLDAPNLWAKVAGNVEEKNPGGVITSAKHGSGYTGENSIVSLQVKGTSEVYRQPETEHAPRVDANHLKPSVQVPRVIYIPDDSVELEQREMGEMGERPVISNTTYSRSGSPSDEVIKTPVREDNRGSSEPQLMIEARDYRPTHRIEAPIDERQIFQHLFREQGSPKLSLQGNGVRFNTGPSSAFEEASFAGVDKVQEPQRQEIIPQTPREYVRTEDNIREIQPELAGEKRVDRIHQPLQQGITSQDVQEYGKHPQINDEAKSETRYGAAPLDAFKVDSVAEKVQESQHQGIMPQTPREYVRTEDNIQEVQPELVAEEKVDRTHQPLQQEITSQDVQEYGKHPQINDEAKSETRYGAAPLDAFEGASVDGKLQESHSQQIIPEIPQEPVRIEGNVQEIQPEPVADEKVDRIHQPLRQEIRPQDVQEYGKHSEPNDDAKIEMRYETAPSHVFEGASVAEKVQKSPPQEIMPLSNHAIKESSIKHQASSIQRQETPREYVRIESNIREVQPELVAEKNVDRIYQPLRQEISPQDLQEYGKHPELNEEIKAETRRGGALPDTFEVGSSPDEKVQKSQPQAVILQAVQESVRARDDVQEIQPELSKNKEIGRIQQLVLQELESQNVQNYGKNPEFRVESQPYGKEIQATASVPELHVEGTSTLQDKIPFYVSKMVAGERSEAIWIQLEPENLGKVKIRVLLRDNKVSVNLSVSRPETKGIIELQVPGIRRSLAQHEISVTEFRVSLENGFSNSNPRYSNLLHEDADTNSRPAYERGDWNGNQSEHSNRRRYYRNDSLVDLFA